MAAGDDPAGERVEARGLPKLGEACKDYIASGYARAASTEQGYRRYAALYLGHWLSRPLDAVTRRDVEGRFRLLTERHGEVPANQCLSFLRSVYRRPCVDHEDLRNPVEQWLAAGGRYHRKTWKRISSPPTCCRAGGRAWRRWWGTRRMELLREIAVPAHMRVFSYAAELAPADIALSTLVRCLGAVHKIREHGVAEGPWEQIALIWRDRGAFPGLGPALAALGRLHMPMTSEPCATHGFTYPKSDELCSSSCLASPLRQRRPVSGEVPREKPMPNWCPATGAQPAANTSA